VDLQSSVAVAIEVLWLLLVRFQHQLLLVAVSMPLTPRPTCIMATLRTHTSDAHPNNTAVPAAAPGQRLPNTAMHTQPHNHNNSIINGSSESRGPTGSPAHPDVNPYPPTKICSQQQPVDNVLPLPTSLRQEQSSQNVLCMHNRHKHSVHCHSAKINHSHYTNAHRRSQPDSHKTNTQQTGHTITAPLTNSKASNSTLQHQQQQLLLRLEQCSANKPAVHWRRQLSLMDDPCCNACRPPAPPSPK